MDGKDLLKLILHPCVTRERSREAKAESFKSFSGSAEVEAGSGLTDRRKSL